MSRNWMFVSIFILFLLEGSLLPVVIPDHWHGRIVPQLVFIVILYFAVYDHRHTALLMGFVFGFLQDIVYYGHMLGPNMFSMGLLGYLIGLLFMSRHTSWFMMMSIAVLGSFTYHMILYAIYSLFSLQRLMFQHALLSFIIPSLFIQLIFALVVYVPMRKWFDRWSSNMFTENEQG